jgi:bacterioferritin (cytochrome b1)
MSASNINLQGRILRIANALNKAQHPSKSKLAIEIGKVVIALESDVPITSSPEGILNAPSGQIIAELSGLLSLKYQKDATYRSFSDRTRGPWRDSLVDHWYEHSKDEREHAYAIAMKIIGFGGDPILATLNVPICPANLTGFFTVLLNLELKAIETERRIIELAGTQDALRVLMEDLMLKDSHHIDDLRRMGNEVLQ